MRRTKIVATIGPACREPDILARLVEAGMDVARLNFSHGTHEEHNETAQRVRDASHRAGRPVAILQDLPGPKLRIGPVRDGSIVLPARTNVHIICGDTAGREGDESTLYIDWPGLARSVAVGEVLYLADGRVRLRAESVRPEMGEIDAVVEVGGAVASRQGFNIPGAADELPAVPEEDLKHLAAGIQIGVDYVALSFVRRPEDVTFLRDHTRAPLISKIEKPQAVASAQEIFAVSDGIMVARGDLGIELPIEEVPMVQKSLLALAGRMAIPSITATQMLDSMITSTRPTRAEVADVANAILDGTDAIMLSQETAVGEHPILAVEMMASIARHTEQSAPYERWSQTRVARDVRDPAYTVAHAAVAAARDLKLDALVIPTLSGRSVQLVSAHRPDVPIYAFSPGKETVRRCGLIWGVTAESMPRVEVTEDLIAAAAQRVVELGWGKPGQRVGITAGLPSGRPGTTSLLQVQVLPEVGQKWPDRYVSPE